MSNKENLAEEYVQRFWKAHQKELKKVFTDGYDAGYEAAEQEMIRFAEWVANNYLQNNEDDWIPKTHCNGNFSLKECQEAILTTQQLLEKFRENH